MACTHMHRLVAATDTFFTLSTCMTSWLTYFRSLRSVLSPMLSLS